MRVKPCPCCGRIPKIVDGVACKDGRRRRIIHCPNYCSVLGHTWTDRDYMIVHDGNEDDNVIYRKWNESLK